GRDVAVAGRRDDAADSARGTRRWIVGPQSDARPVDDDVAAQVDVVACLRGEATSPIGEVQVCLQIDIVMRLNGYIPVRAQAGVYSADRDQAREDRQIVEAASGRAGQLVNPGQRNIDVERIEQPLPA